MISTPRKHQCVLGVAANTRGLGFVVLEGETTLVTWGGSTARRDKNASCIAKVKRLIARYRPDVLVSENVSGPHSRRASRIKDLVAEIVAIGKMSNITTVQLPPEQLRRIYYPNGSGTKHDRAEILAKKFPLLADYMPPKRHPWMSEDSRMGIFDALAVAYAYRIKKSF